MTTPADPSPSPSQAGSPGSADSEPVARVRPDWWTSLQALEAVLLPLHDLRNPESLAQRTIEVLEEKLGYEYGAVLVVERETGCLVPFALSSQGLDSAFTERDKVYVASLGVEVGRGITGHVAATGRRVRAGDVRTDPRYLEMRPGIRSELCVPLIAGGEVIGVLNTETTRLDAYSDVDESILSIVATHLALAIQNDDLFRRLQERNEALEELVAARTADLEEANKALWRLSRTDSLTGVSNRRLFDEQLEIECRRASRSGTEVSVLMVDVDHFKAVNDLLGHQAGDECLRKVARALRSGVYRAQDFLARYGGEEFAVILPETGCADACLVAERLRGAVHAAAIAHPGSPTDSLVTVSIGVGTVHGTERNANTRALFFADEALYEAKGQGRNRVSTYSSPNPSRANA